MSDSFKCNKILLLLSFLHITVVHSLSCPTLCDPMDCSMPGFPVLQYLLEFALIYFHLIGDSIQHLTLCHPLLLLPSIFPGIWVFSNEPALRIKWSKYWSFNFSISPSSEYSGLVSLSIDWFDLLAVQRTFKSLHQHENISSSVLSLLYGPTLMSMHNYWKNHRFDYTDLFQQWSLLCNILSRFVIAFLPRSKCLLISWLQLQSAMILELKKIKSVTTSTSPSFDTYQK